MTMYFLVHLLTCSGLIIAYGNSDGGKEQCQSGNCTSTSPPNLDIPKPKEDSSSPAMTTKPPSPNICNDSQDLLMKCNIACTPEGCPYLTSYDTTSQCDTVGDNCKALCSKILHNNSGKCTSNGTAAESTSSSVSATSTAKPEDTNAPVSAIPTAKPEDTSGASVSATPATKAEDTSNANTDIYTTMFFAVSTESPPAGSLPLTTLGIAVVIVVIVLIMAALLVVVFTLTLVFRYKTKHMSQRQDTATDVERYVTKELDQFSDVNKDPLYDTIDETIFNGTTHRSSAAPPIPIPTETGPVNEHHFPENGVPLMYEEPVRSLSNSHTKKVDDALPVFNNSTNVSRVNGGNPPLTQELKDYSLLEEVAYTIPDLNKQPQHKNARANDEAETSNVPNNQHNYKIDYNSTSVELASSSLNHHSSENSTTDASTIMPVYYVLDPSCEDVC